ncbi:MAG TPA: CoA-acylating methylmalonate-semialdehyde dehydrogenase [Blastocatellia bacterium]|nr:CoA-acylating methylmalonate-semialdehyde dehydrogenase [Blastocatellia bacterium]
MSTNGQLQNYINGEWRRSEASEYMQVINPATTEPLAQVPLGGADDVGAAVDAASAAFAGWRTTPPEDRIQFLFKLKHSLEEHFEEIGRLITMENGKTLTEAKAEVRRAIENVEVACGIPTLMQGCNLEDVARGIDEMMIRQPLGVVAAICPFNFPVMVPFWFLPYAIACGNTFVLKPSERVPVSMQRLFELFDELGLPPGVLNMVNGGKDAVDALLDHPGVRAISFVGSTPIARYVYSRGSASGKRVQAQGGAKNHVVVLPDADMDMTAQIINDSAFGCAGQRCLAVSTAITVGQARQTFTEAITDLASSINTNYGLEEGAQMGPVITRESKARIEGLISKGAGEGATVVLDGRSAKISKYENGNFVKPTILDNVVPGGEISNTEIFGPVLSVTHVQNIEEAIQLIAQSPYGNAASIFTTSGAAARKFRYEASAGNIGINIGVAAPMAYFPFSGWKDSFFGVEHAQGRDGVEFYTEKKVVIERWPKDWSRKF